MRQSLREATSNRRAAGDARSLSRVLGIGFIAVGAIAASLLLGRLRPEPVAEQAPDVAPPGDATPPGLELDAIRAAGF